MAGRLPFSPAPLFPCSVFCRRSGKKTGTPSGTRTPDSRIKNLVYDALRRPNIASKLLRFSRVATISPVLLSIPEEQLPLPTRQKKSSWPRIFFKPRPSPPPD